MNNLPTRGDTTAETRSHRWLALGALVLGVMAIGLDQTVLNLALPTLSRSLNASESQLQWFVTAYTLALVAGMLPAGLPGLNAFIPRLRGRLRGLEGRRQY